jgi:hypothetical protein
MKTEFRNRAFLPLVIPLAILLAIGAVVGLVALILLFVDRQGAVALALLGAAGILVAVSLAASQDRLDLPRKGAIALAGVAPILIGGLVAVGAVGGLADEDRNINVEPHGPQFVTAGLPSDDTPVMAADSLNGFCLPEECDGGSTTTNAWEMAQSEAEQFAYAFDNLDPATEHNLMIYNVPPEELDGLDSALSLGDVQANYRVITPEEPPNVAPGSAETYGWPLPVVTEDGEEINLPEQAYFVCTLHPSTMWGVATITPA